jgi:hypothetical protein
MGRNESGKIGMAAVLLFKKVLVDGKEGTDNEDKNERRGHNP